MGKNGLSLHDIMRWSDDECRTFLEAQRWPDGPVCPKCGASEPYTIQRKTASKNLVRKLYKCRSCKRQFSPTVDTIFEDSKIPLHKWFAAIYLMCSSKKGISAHQLHRTLDITYKSAWFMCHRVREAMNDKGFFQPIKGTVEADETYIGPKTRRGGRAWRERVQDEVEMGLREKPKNWKEEKTAVFGMIERGGRVKTMVVPDDKASTLKPIMTEMIDLNNARLMTDGARAYRSIKDLLPHEYVNHEIEYVRGDGDIHTNNIESYWSNLKRGIYGVFHHVGDGYLPQYLGEFEYRFNRRKMTDSERFASLMSQMQGRLLWYCQTPQPENPHA